MDSEQWATIRRMREVDKQSISAISRQLHIHRDTVRRALSSISSPPVNEPRGRLAEDKLGPFARYIGDRLKEYPDLTASKLLLEIRKQGYRGGYTILKEYVRDLRPASAPGAFLRLETQPGEYAQVDWANIGSVQIGNARRQLSCFVMVLSYSRMMYLEFTLSQKLKDFMAAHVNAFRYFGGVPQIINYDNLKTVVLSRVGADMRFHPRFMDFAGYYLIKPVPCGIRKANEKGRVERGFGTHQDRLVKELRLAGISNMEDGNVFLAEVYVPEHNARFAVPPENNTNAHRPLLKSHRLEEILSLRTERTVTNDYTIRKDNQFFQLPADQPVRVKPKDKVLVEMRLDGSRHMRFKETYLGFKSIAKPPYRPFYAGKKEVATAKWPVKPNKPAKNHPWRRFNFVAPKAAVIPAGLRIKRGLPTLST